MFAEALAATLDTQPGIEVAGCAATVASALREAERLQPNVVLMDYRLPDGQGTAAARTIRSRLPSTRVLIVTASSEDALVREAMRAGCSGIVAKGRSLRELVSAVRAAAAGETVVAPAVLERVMSPGASQTAGARLTEREAEVLRLTAEGLGTREVADELGLSIHTVRNHLQNSIRKLGVHSVTQAVSAAIRRGIIPAPG